MELPAMFFFLYYRYEQIKNVAEKTIKQTNKEEK